MQADAEFRDPWDVEALLEPPDTWQAEGFEAEGVRALYYRGLPWKGEETRVFAWYGAPARDPSVPTDAAGLPAMVLVHGGGGTAFAEWVRLWNSRGYAAIAMDTCGCVAGGEHGARQRHDLGGPPGWGGFDQTGWPVRDRWMYHAVADVILASSLVRSFPEVDPERVGLSGISWGGVLACTVAGLDARSRFAAPVYGCGFAGARPRPGQGLGGMDEAAAAEYLRLFDPARYLPHARAPMLWLNGTNDFAFDIHRFRESYRLPAGERTVGIRVRMPHGQPEGESPGEIRVFADSILRGGRPLARVTGQGTDGRRSWAEFRAEVPVARAELCCTSGSGEWVEREWRTLPAELDRAASRAEALLPEGATAHYLALIDADGMLVSSEHVEAGDL